jgi:hypothetical protein
MNGLGQNCPSHGSYCAAVVVDYQNTVAVDYRNEICPFVGFLSRAGLLP